jgi:site-specific recombinase XerD
MSLISKADLQHFAVHLRERGVRPVTCNTWVRALNAICRWLHEQGELPVFVKLKPQRLEKRLVRTHDEATLKAFFAAVRFGQLKDRVGVRSDLMFPAREGGRWDQRNALRSLYCLLKRLGVPRSGFHRLRHTFATQYLRNGGDVVRLSIILGHSEVSTTMKYLHLLTEDLRRPHQSLSILNRLR